MQLRTQIKTIIEEKDFSEFVSSVYGRCYRYQQQDGCKPRGVVEFTASTEEWTDEDDAAWPSSIPDKINGEEMGVSFAAWLDRDPAEWNGRPGTGDYLDLFWERNFYPPLEAVVTDLCKRGLMEPGEYVLNIDW